MSFRSRTVYRSNKHTTLVLEENGQKVLYQLQDPESVAQLFAKHGFPNGAVGSGVRLDDEPTGPSLLLFRTYVQRMPGQKQPEKLIWCCQVLPDRDAEAPSVHTPEEALKKFGIQT